MKFLRLITLFLLLPVLLASCYHRPENTSISGIVNSYAAVSAIDPCEGVVVDRTDGFHPDQLVLVIQMQGADIDGRNHAGYGEVEDLAGAGRAEYARISHIERNQIVFSKQLVNRYNPHGSVQVVSVPEYQDVVVERPVYAPRWDGRTGGVVALHVRGKLVLKADVDVSGAGFRGGKVIEQTRLVPQYVSDYVGTDVQALSSKGEGIAGFGDDRARLGRGAPANGGGGGGNHNAGGGAGANAGAGGTGGYAYAHSRYSGDRTSAQGLGGHALSGRGLLFAGGGGGAGHSNNRTGSDGAAGGGIVVIRAGSVVSDGGAIRARGGNSETAPYDGAGGAGAGGTIYLDLAGCHGSSLRLDASGGNGGNTANNVEQAHVGAGGGGGGGLIIMNRPATETGADGAPVSLSIAGGKGGKTIRGTNDGTTDGADGRVIPLFDILMGRERCDRIFTGSKDEENEGNIEYE